MGDLLFPCGFVRIAVQELPTAERGASLPTVEAWHLRATTR